VSAALAPAPERQAGPPRPRRMTLEERLAGALERTRVAGDAQCPVCSGTLERRVDGADCRDCGANIH
jgi:DnaJ-class molecular chaperone